MTTALITTKPTKLTAAGKATDFETIDIALPVETQAKVTVRVGYFPRTAEDLPGWRAEATISRIDVTTRSGAVRERWRVIVDAVEALTNRLIDASERDHVGRRERDWLKTVIDALNLWIEGFEKQAKKESNAMIATKSPKILSGKECRALLEDFRRSYESCQHAFLKLGEKAATIREQEAYGEIYETFDQWIKSEGYGHTLVYDSMKAARIYRLMSPILETRKITLDCESHYRDIPADVTPKEAKAIAGELLKMVGPDPEIPPKLTRGHVREAVEAVRPKAAATRPDVPESIEAEIAAVEKPSGPAEPQAPRLAPETITGEYVEVQADTPPCAQGLAALPLVDAETPPTWMAELTAARANLARWLQRWEGSEDFRYEAGRMLEDLAVSLKTHTLSGDIRRPARRAK